MVTRVEAGIILEDCVNPGLLRVPQYPRSTVDSVDVDKIQSMLLSGFIYSRIGPAESRRRLCSSDMKMRLPFFPSTACHSSA